MISGAYKDSGHLTEAAIERIGNTWAGFGDGPRYDPILCAQDIPESFTVEPATIAGDQARVYVRMLWNGSPATSQTATLVLADGEWRIDDLTCAIQGETATAPAPDGTAANGETANWQIFRDADHGYEIKYPQGWKTIQPEVPPVDGSPLLLATGFAPEDGPRDLVPVSVEVYRGSLEEFLTAYPGNGEFEFMEINGAEVLFDPADPVQGDAFYIFQDAGHADLRVVLRHTVMARQVVDDLDGIVERMVATFRFAD